MPVRCAFFSPSLFLARGAEGQVLEMAPGDHVANIPPQKFGCGGLPQIGFGFRSGQVASVGCFHGFRNLCISSLHNITSISPSFFLLYLPTWSDGERHETAATAAAQSKGARAAHQWFTRKIAAAAAARKSQIIISSTKIADHKYFWLWE